MYRGDINIFSSHDHQSSLFYVNHLKQKITRCIYSITSLSIVVLQFSSECAGPAGLVVSPVQFPSTHPHMRSFSVPLKGHKVSMSL